MSKSDGKKIKSIIGNLAKWLLAAGLLVALVKSGKLNPENIKDFLSHPGPAVFCLLLIATSLNVAFLRWKTLLAGVGIEMDYWPVLRLGMLGQFFSIVIPGAVSGDLVKGVYVAKRFPGRKMVAVSTILLDRVLGLCAMVLMAALASLVGFETLWSLSGAGAGAVKGLASALMVLGAVIFVSMLLFAPVARRLPAVLPQVLARLPGYGFLNEFYKAVLLYRDRPSYLWAAVGLSVLNHSVNLGILYTAASTIFGPAPWGTVTFPLFVVGAILGIASQAIPIGPAGLGVGQVAFSAIFVAIGAPSAAFGSAIITVLQLYSVSLGLTGAFFFATYKHEAQLTEAHG